VLQNQESQSSAIVGCPAVTVPSSKVKNSGKTVANKDRNPKRQIQANSKRECRPKGFSKATSFPLRKELLLKVVTQEKKE